MVLRHIDRVPATLLSLNISPAHRVSDNRSGATLPAGESAPARHRVDARGFAGAEAAGGTSPSASLSRALYAYPSEHYPFWNTVRAQLGLAAWTDALAPGALGEHLTLSGVLESDVWVGDLLRFADCTLAVSEPRFPGAELNTSLGFPHAQQAMTAQAWCGFYLAVGCRAPWHPAKPSRWCRGRVRSESLNFSAPESPSGRRGR
jgi:MOSC domain-containing protein YiiM